jgi:dipeptidyl aminopeptidase/acylaminoacyl peptidase
MAERQIRPFGSWPSPISIEMAVRASLALREPMIDAEDVYWTEGRPQEKGRQVVVRWNDREGTRDVTPAGFNARTMASEYGGGAYMASGGTVFFSNLEDGRLCRQRTPDEQPAPITPAGPFRYGDLVFDHRRARLLCVREDHTPVAGAEPDGGAGSAGGAGRPSVARGPEPENTLVAIDPETCDVSVLAAGHDFFSTPRPSPDGARLAWLAWRHPNMPWDGTELWLAEVESSGALRKPRQVAGGNEESIVQPEWAPDGTLVFASDRSGWWNLYRLPIGDGDGAGQEASPLAPMEAEFAGPQWVYGMSWFDIAADGTIVATAHRDGRDELWMIPAGGGSAERVEVPDEQIGALRVGGQRVVYIGGSATETRRVVVLQLSSGERRVLRESGRVEVDPAYFSRPEPISFPTTNGAIAHALFYRPTNPSADAPPGERPPLVVMSHGGPTSSAFAGLNLENQLFTSRGFAVVDVDYGGSSGHGREYMRRLDGQWGVVDVDDCVNAARFLAEQGEVDAQRMAIRGGSAGGFTTLAALVFEPDVFAAGASHYGVGDLEALARDTHKFESRYLDRLVAPYPAGVELYRQRSPIYYTDRIRVPLIVLQGADDNVVPVAQAEQLVAALRERRIPHAYLLFEGEGHGFRQAEHIKRALQAELSFYAQVFGFALADQFEPVEVEFLPAQ